jgi:hypothetical protein
MIVTRTKILNIIAAYPRVSGHDIYAELVRRSWAGRWFGENSFLAKLLGPSVGGMYIILAKMEKDGVLTSEWGAATAETARPMRAKIVSWLGVIVSWLGVIVVIFASWVLAVMVRDLVHMLLLRFGGGVQSGMRVFLLPRIVPAILMLLIFGVGATLMRAKFRGATVWKTIAILAVVFGMLGLIMGITGSSPYL